MRRIKGVELEFENCESIYFESKSYGNLYMSDFTKQIVNLSNGTIIEREFVGEVVIELFSEAEETGRWISAWSDDANKFERIAHYDDITHITLHYADDSMQTYCIDYLPDSEDLGAPNVSQKSYISTLGNLYVVISKKNRIDDYFDRDVIENAELMEYRKRLIL